MTRKTINSKVARALWLVVLLMTAISADAKGHAVTDWWKNSVSESWKSGWEVSATTGMYHPNYYAMKYFFDCSGSTSGVEVRKQVTPGFALGVELNMDLRMGRTERKDPRTLFGPVLHFNMMNIFGGRREVRRFFEVEADMMLAWGHLYRGTHTFYFPEENYLSTKYGVSMNFNVGKQRQWAVVLKPAMVMDLTSQAPDPAVNNLPNPGAVIGHPRAYDIKKSELQLLVGFIYRLPTLK